MICMYMHASSVLPLLLHINIIPCAVSCSSLASTPATESCSSGTTTTAAGITSGSQRDPQQRRQLQRLRQRPPLQPRSRQQLGPLQLLQVLVLGSSMLLQPAPAKQVLQLQELKAATGSSRNHLSSRVSRIWLK